MILPFQSGTIPTTEPSASDSTGYPSPAPTAWDCNQWPASPQCAPTEESTESLTIDTTIANVDPSNASSSDKKVNRIYSIMKMIIVFLVIL